MRGRSTSIIPRRPRVASFAKHPSIIIKREICLKHIGAIASRKIVAHRESIIIRYKLGSSMQKLIVVAYGQVVTQRESFMSKDRARCESGKWPWMMRGGGQINPGTRGWSIEVVRLSTGVILGAGLGNSDRCNGWWGSRLEGQSE
ncbi:hypothetical protein PanWU01x14_075060 [Parasponia andersonii]|uniref:Uncharacterized protein n=1 Tax=Parasponia andersonii TaxID=3476 RepID=A0A2P5DCR7_PARAD|nr:hypothetical protein PanWU01x14_075060 [Parasponia andersonii]